MKKALVIVLLLACAGGAWWMQRDEGRATRLAAILRERKADVVIEHDTYNKGKLSADIRAAREAGVPFVVFWHSVFSCLIASGFKKSSDIYPLLKERGIGLFVTGITAEIRPWVRERNRIARECGVSILGGTHYSTEKFALIDMLEFFRSLGLDCAFIPDGPKLRDL